MERSFSYPIFALLLLAYSCQQPNSPDTSSTDVAGAKSSLTIAFTAGDSTSAVTGNLTLPTVGPNGVSIAWSSSAPGVISNTGVVARPAAGQSDSQVVLTATFSKNSASDTKTYSLTVKALAPTLAVVYLPNGGTGTVTDSRLYGTGQKVTTKANTFTRTGYTFSNWNTQAGGGGASYLAGATFSISSSCALYAQWAPNSYTVSFDTQGGSSVSSVTGNYNTTISLPTQPTKTGSVFTGWYTATNGGGTQFTGSTVVTASLTVYATWSTNSYMVSFNSQGGSAVSSVNANYNTTISLPSQPTKTGYAFAGWYTATNGGGTQFTGSTAVTASLTVFASWSINSYAVSFDCQGGSPISSVNANYNTTISLPTQPTKTGYTFAGWYTATNGGGTQFTGSTAVTASMTVYANWSNISYMVSFNSQGGSAVPSVTANYNTTISLPVQPTKTGYTFAGWYTATNGGGTQFTGSTAVTANLTVYASWSINSYAVSFDSQGGSSVSSVTANYNTTISLPVQPTKTGYTFAGWYTATNGGGTQFTGSTAVTANLTVYASWSINSYAVSFDSQGGSSVSSVTANYNTTISLPSNPTKTGYAFAGWYTATNGGGTQFTGSTAVTVSQTAYAHWVVSVATISPSRSGTMILKTDGTLWATGYNFFGQLGDGTTVSKSAPVQVMTEVSKVSAWFGFTMIIKTDGTLWATGENNSGNFGNGTTISSSTPIQVTTGISSVSAGAAHTMMLKPDGTLWATGDNTFGQFGDGTTVSKSTPVQVMTEVSKVYAGYYCTMIIKNDGTLWATGENSSGQLGDGTTASKITPVQVMNDVSSVSLGMLDSSTNKFYSMILKTDGTLWATGENGSGQLGDGTTVSKISPVQVMSGVSSVSAGMHHTMILKTDGSLWVTGSKLYGSGLTSSRSTPIQVATGVSFIAAGGAHLTFLKADGSLWVYGRGLEGQLGIGTNDDTFEFVQVK